MALNYYYDLLSQPCRALMILLKLNKVKFEDHGMQLMKGEHKTDAYKAINPFGAVPAITVDKFRLAETFAIFRFIHKKFELDEHWYPSGLEERARHDECLSWYYTNMRQHGPRVFFPQVLMHMKGPVAEANIQAAKDGLDKVLDTMENVFLANHAFLCGDKISFADILFACEITQVDLAKLHPIFTDSRPKLKSWFQMVKQETQPHFDEAHKAIEALADQWLQSQK